MCFVNSCVVSLPIFRHILQHCAECILWCWWWSYYTVGIAVPCEWPSCAGGHPEISPWGKGTPRLYRSNLCLILKTMLRKSCRKYESNITLFAAEFMYVQTNIAKCSMPLAPDYKSRCLIYLVFASLDVWILFFKIPLPYSSVDFSGWYRPNGKITLRRL